MWIRVIRLAIILAALFAMFWQAGSVLAQKADPQVLQERINSIVRELDSRNTEVDAMRANITRSSVNVERRLSTLESQGQQNEKLLWGIISALGLLGGERVLAWKKGQVK